jgi:autotransporter-associated beta strand protein
MAAVSVGAPPAYNSKPNATRHIYLDFNGALVSGKAWSATDGTTTWKSWDCAAWGTDGDATTFSDAEQAEMKRVWQRISEDYAPYDINVTTDVTYDSATYTGNKNNVGWLLFTATTDKTGARCPHYGSGGVAYVGVFGNSNFFSTYQPAWVTPTGSANMAEAASHEMGHNLGLTHDGTSTLTYYGGHGATASAPSWGPIMGTGYGRDVSQWSKGEYFDANLFQDDLTVIANRVPYRADDHGGTAGTATALTIINGTTISSTTPETDPSNSNPANKGVIERNTDVDVFSFYTGAGSVQLNANPWIQPSGTKGGNLDILLELYNEAGTLVASNNAASLTTASISTTLVQGSYYLRVRNTGSGTPLVSPPSGYTSYGSIGQYFISGTIVAANQPLALTSITPASGNAGSNITVDITGTALAAETSMKLTQSGRADILGSSVQLSGSTLRCQFDLTGAAAGLWSLHASNPDLESATLPDAFTVNAVPTTLWSENFDGTVTGWTSLATLGTHSWVISTTQSHSATSSYRASAPATKVTSSLTSPAIVVPSGATNLQLKFWHSYGLDSQKDGGRLELSVDDGASWFGVESVNSGASFTRNGYTATIGTGNRIARSEFNGLLAWTGTSSGFVETLVDLTTAKFANKTIRARWIIATDASVSSSGWHVDSISLIGSTSDAPPNQAPVITVAASTSSGETETDGPTIYQIIRGTGTSLSVTATDDEGESSLTYTWEATSGPSPVGFSENGNNAAKITTAAFNQTGDYLLTVTALDAGELASTSSVNVRVSATGTYVVTPASESVEVGTTQQFVASLFDQFGTPVATQPSPINWSTTGGGSISASGLFSATSAGGPFTITAASGTFADSAAVFVTAGTASVQLTNLNQTYNGSPIAVTVTTQPPGLAHSVTYNTSSTVPTAAGTYAVVATITDPNYVGSASGNLLIAKAPQTIHFAALETSGDEQPPFQLTGTASSGLAVSYSSSNTDVAVVSDNTVTIVGLGTTTITASQAGNTNYDAAAAVPQTLTVGRSNPLAVITGGPYKLLAGQSLSLDGSASQASFGETITTYEWDLNNDNTFGDVAGATPSAIDFATLADTWGMTQGLNPIQLKITDSSNKTSLVSSSVELLHSLTWDANGIVAGQTNGAGDWLDNNQWWDDSNNRDWISGLNAVFGGSNTEAGAVTLASPTTVHSLIFSTFTGTYTLGTPGQTLAVNGGIQMTSSSAAVALLSPIALGAAQTWTNHSTAGFIAGNNNQAIDLGSHALTLGGAGNFFFNTADDTGITLTGSGNLIKEGSGTFALGGANTYDGAITVNQGKLLITGSLSNIDAALTVNSGATLGGSGTIGRNVTIEEGGKLEFAISTDDASHDGLEISSGRSFAFSGASELTITSSSGATPGTYTLITGGDPITGSAPATVNLPEGWAATVTVSGNSLLLNIASTIVVESAFVAWADSSFPNGYLANNDAAADPDGGGLATGIEWVVGGDPTTGADDAALAPTCDLTTDPAYFTFTYRRSDAANTDANTSIHVQYCTAIGDWINAVEGPDIIITEHDNFHGSEPGIDKVELKIKRTPELGNKLFARLQVVIAP